MLYCIPPLLSTIFRKNKNSRVAIVIKIETSFYNSSQVFPNHPSSAKNTTVYN